MFDRCDDRARSVFCVARRMAISKGHGRIGSLHLLFGIAKYLRDENVACAVRQRVETALGAEYPRQKNWISQLPFSPSATRVCDYSAEATDPAEPITPASLLAAILRQRDDPAARILADLGVDESTALSIESEQHRLRSIAQSFGIGLAIGTTIGTVFGIASGSASLGVALGAAFGIPWAVALAAFSRS